MQRTYLSDAKKRKMKEDKKDGENALLSKAPKINQLFVSSPSTSTNSNTNIVTKIVAERYTQLQ